MGSKFRMKWLEKEDLADDGGGDEDFQEVEEESPSVSASGPSSRSGSSTASASGGMKKKNIEDIKFGHPSSYLIAGLTKCGKTKWLRSFVFNNHDKYNRIYAFSSSAKFNQDYDFLSTPAARSATSATASPCVSKNIGVPISGGVSGVA
jgi:hypothetical protein